MTTNIEQPSSLKRDPTFHYVSERALIQRINRVLHEDDLLLRKVRPGSRGEWELGPFYTINWRHNFICDKGIYLDDLGRELGVLKDYERLKVEGQS